MNKYHLEINGQVVTKRGKKLGCIAIDTLEAESYFIKKGFHPTRANAKIICEGPAHIRDWAPALVN